MSYKLDEKDESLSVWRVLKRGTHARITEEIIRAMEEARRLPTTEGIVRMTGRRLGQELASLAGFRPEASLTSDTHTIFRLLPPQTALSLAEEIAEKDEVKRLFVAGDWRKAVDRVSRMTGRAVGASLSITATRAVKHGAQLGG